MRGHIIVCGEDPLGMPDLRNDVSSDVRLARCRDADRLMVLNVKACSTPEDHPAFTSNDVARLYLVPEFGDPAVNRDGA